MTTRVNLTKLAKEITPHQMKELIARYYIELAKEVFQSMAADTENKDTARDAKAALSDSYRLACLGSTLLYDSDHSLTDGINFEEYV